jgi:hypothetical protein
MWLENGNGASFPVRINAPQITWMDEDVASSADTVSVFGRNLSRNNDTIESYVYIRKWASDKSAKSIRCQVTSVDPYHVKFIVPENIPQDSAYEVWLHNGHGGVYGWAGPLKILISQRKMAPSGRLLNVKNYGAEGNGRTDDAKAIQRAINAAHDYDTIYFPQGEYRLAADSITCSKRIILLGAGREASIIVADSSFKRSDMIRITAFPSQVTQLSLVTSKPHGKGLNILLHADGSKHEVGNDGFIVRQCSFKTAAFGGNAVETNLYGIKCVAAEYVNHVVINENRFETQEAVNVYSARQVRIQHNHIYGNWKVTRGNGNLMLSFPAKVQEMDISNNVFESVDKDGPLDDGDRIIVRAIVFQNWRGGRYDRIFIGHNTIERAGNPWDNSGEVILFELPTSNHVYHLASSNGPELQLKASLKENSLATQTVAIIKNTGIGQYRRILSNKGNTLTLDRPWDVQPDASSVFSLNSSAENVVIYKNTVDGVPNFYDQESATSGIQLYGAAFNNIIANNVFSNVHHGIYLTGFAGHPSTESLSTGVMGNLVTDNKVSHAVYGLENITVMYRYVMPTPLPKTIPWASNVNNVFRDNEVSDLRQFSVKGVLHGGYGIVVGQVYNDWQSPVWDGPWVQRGLIEHNLVKNAAGKFVWLRQHQQWTTLRKNVFIDNVSSTNATGIYFSPENRDSYLIDNSYGNEIDTVYGGKLPGPHIAVSQLALGFEVVTGNKSKHQQVLVYNTGTGSLNITARADAEWATVKINNSQVENEQQHCEIIVGVNTGKLKKGTHRGMLTITDTDSGETANISIKAIVK